MKTMRLLGLLLLLLLISLAQVVRPPVETDDKGTVKSLYDEYAALNNFNVFGVVNNPTVPTTFTLSQSCLITTIQTYHCINGRGAGLGTIKLVHANGTVYGPWTATGSPGSGGVANAFWTVTPNVTVPAGTYTVVDGNNATWSCNSQSQNKGFAKVLAKRIRL